MGELLEGVTRSLAGTKLGKLGASLVDGIKGAAVSATDTPTTAAENEGGEQQQPLVVEPTGPPPPLPVTFARFFDEHLGGSHLGALELLSEAQGARAHTTISKLPMKLRIEMQQAEDFVVDTLQIDEVGDEELDRVDSEEFGVWMNRLDDLVLAGNINALALVESRDAAIAAYDALLAADKNDEESPFLPPPMDEPLADTTLLRPAAARRLALDTCGRLAAQYVYCLRKAAELLLVDEAGSGEQDGDGKRGGDQGGVSGEDLKRKAEGLRDISLAVVNELQAVAKRGAEYIHNTAPEDNALGRAMHSDVFVEADSAEARVQDALKLLVPVFRAILASASSSP